MSSPTPPDEKTEPAQRPLNSSLYLKKKCACNDCLVQSSHHSAQCTVHIHARKEAFSLVFTGQMAKWLDEMNSRSRGW